ncbi:MAG: hypothetical protein ACRD11_03960 [Terriglobia bacterium]
MRSIVRAVLIAWLVIAAGCGPARGRSQAKRERAASAANFSGWPKVILWAWQRRDNLSFIDPKRSGVSYLVETIRIGRAGIALNRNENGFVIPAGTWLMACVRIEMQPGYAPPPSMHEAGKIASLLLRVAQFPGAKAIQIDFDATVSQRRFYRRLLATLRCRLPVSMPLSITALASWCEGDDWISGLPVSEAVPMLFRMGADSGSILLRLQAGGDFREPLCRSSAGISTDEFAPRLPRGRRVYIFAPEGWTKASFDATMSRAGL